MADVGYLSLVMALVVTLYGTLTSVLAQRWYRGDFVESARRALYAYTVLVTTSVISLEYLLLTDHFQVKYVAEHSERALPMVYKIAALWSAPSGSLLVWSFILGLYVTAAATYLHHHHLRLTAWLYAIFHSIAMIFVSLLLFVANPFTLLTTTPPDGNGLLPVFQNPWMIVHPLSLYLGYIGFTVPFAYTLSALLTEQVNTVWAYHVRRWTLIPWLFLSLGILTGAQWAYLEPSGKSFWAWGSVANITWLPWLTGTAFLHSILIQERRGVLRVWNVMLIFFTFWLAVLGLFLSRNGGIAPGYTVVLPQTNLPFWALWGALFVSLCGVLVWRWPTLRAEPLSIAPLSREGIFLVNNVLFTVPVFGTLASVLWSLGPKFAGNELALEVPLLNRVNGPLFIALLALMGIGLLLPWQRTSGRALWDQLIWPSLGSLAVSILLLLAGERRLWAILGWASVTLALIAIVQEYIRGLLGHRATGKSIRSSLTTLLRHHPRRYGGYLVHLGVVLVAISILGSTFYQATQQGTLRVGEALAIGEYRLVYQGLFERRESNHDQLVGRLSIFRGDAFVGVLEPAHYIYDKQPELPIPKAALYVTWREDLYVALTGWEQGGDLASIQARVYPLRAWLWLGSLLVMAGTLMAWWPAPQWTRIRIAAPASSLPRPR